MPSMDGEAVGDACGLGSWLTKGFTMAAKSESFSAEERAAMKERAKEQKAAATKAEALADVLAKFAEMPANERAIAERIHAIVAENAPQLDARTWYGQPAYALDGTVVCFFQPASKFNTRYSTLGFSDAAKLDDGSMWSSAFAISALSAADEKTIAGLVKRAVS